VEQHFGARLKAAELRTALENRAVQFRNIEKRLLMRFKVRRSCRGSATAAAAASAHPHAPTRPPAAPIPRGHSPGLRLAPRPAPMPLAAHPAPLAPARRPAFPQDKNPAPLNQLDSLMNDTYNSLIDLGDALEAAQVTRRATTGRVGVRGGRARLREGRWGVAAAAPRVACIGCPRVRSVEAGEGGQAWRAARVGEGGEAD
jgi:hypothetical protein